MIIIYNIVYHSCICYNTAKQNGSNVRKNLKIKNKNLGPGIVVQSVRAPPCQGGSCGFEPRQSRPRIR